MFATDTIEQSPCPVSTPTATTLVAPEEELALPHRKRICAGYEQTPCGQTEYRIYYGTKEVSFEEPELFGFAEALVAQSRFVARAAASWGAGYSWDIVQPLLSQLVEEGILRRIGAADCLDDRVRNEGLLPSQLPPTVGCEPHTWVDCAALTEDLSGHSVPLGYVELIVPVYRIVHPMLDRDQRQIGEGNVFPSCLRLDVNTEWRRCQYPGSRYQDECPMNVTALKAMIKHWPSILHILERCRAQYVERFPDAQGRMSLGHIERLSIVVLAVPTFLAMRGSARLENGELHPVLSSLFRVTDGLRLTAHQLMLDTTDERGARDPDGVVDCAELLAYVERTAGFMSGAGVCAGPRHMIDEFLGVVVNGAPVRGSGALELAPEVQEALDMLAPAFEYGLLGMQATAVTVSFWASLAAGYERVHAAVRAIELESAALGALREQCSERLSHLARMTTFVEDDTRLPYERLYAQAFQQASRGLGDGDSRSLAERLLPAVMPADEAMREVLRSALQERLLSEGHVAAGELEPLVYALVAAIFDGFRAERALLALGSTIQERINRLLGREWPERPLVGADLCVYAWLFDRSRPFPSFAHDVEVNWGVKAQVTRDAVLVMRSAAANGAEAKLAPPFDPLYERKLGGELI